MSCPTPVRLSDHARGRLSERRASEVRAHVAGCANCRVVLTRVGGAVAGLDAAARLEPAAPSSSATDVRAEATLRWARLGTGELRAVRGRWGLALGLGALGAAAAAALAIAWPFGHPVVAPVPVAVAPPAPRPTPAPETIKGLVTLVGGASARAAARPLTPGTLVGEGETLETGAASLVGMQWGDGAGLLLRDGSALSVDTLRVGRQRLGLKQGQVDVRVRPGASPTAAKDGEALLAVATAGHVVSVRGTWFTVAAAEYRGGTRTTVEVYEGTVEVSDRDGPGTTVLRAPSRGVFYSGVGAARATTRPLSAAEAAEARQKSELGLLGWPAGGAAELAGGLGTLRVSSESATARVAFDGVELGAAPLALARPQGRHLIEVSRRGFAPLRRWVTIGPEPGELHAALVKLPEPHEAPAPPPPAILSPVEPASDEPSRAAIEAMIQRRGRQVRACYERSLKHDPQLAGTITLRIRLDEVGRVRGSSIEEGATLPEPELSQVGECLRREAAGWSFPGGRNSTIVYPFVFRTQ